jgi:hypothetical protein
MTLPATSPLTFLPRTISADLSHSKLYRCRGSLQRVLTVFGTAQLGPVYDRNLAATSATAPTCRTTAKASVADAPRISNVPPVEIGAPRSSDMSPPKSAPRTTGVRPKKARNIALPVTNAPRTGSFCNGLDIRSNKFATIIEGMRDAMSALNTPPLFLPPTTPATRPPKKGIHPTRTPRKSIHVIPRPTEALVILASA